LLREEDRIFATSEGLSVASKAGGEVRSIYAFHGLPSNRLYSLADQDGHLFVGTLGGVALVDGLRVRQRLRAAPGGLQANWCSAMAAAAEGIYMGTTGGGVDLRRPDGSVDRLPMARPGRFTVNPGAMLVAGQRLLVGTLEHGLLVLDRARQEWLDIEQPLPGAAVTALAVDDDFLYVGTNRGLLRLGRDVIGEST
jgi:ligand-binding sensor domain-containing protein